MKESTNREKILKKVRSALIQKTKNPFPLFSFDRAIYPPVDEVPELIFAQRFSESGGNFIFCENNLEFGESLLQLFLQKKPAKGRIRQGEWKTISCNDENLLNFLKEIEFPNLMTDQIKTPDVVLTSCECLVARTGNILVSSVNGTTNTYSADSVNHIIYATTGQLQLELKDAFDFLKLKYKNRIPSSVTLLKRQHKTTGAENISAPELFLFLVDEPDKQTL